MTTARFRPETTSIRLNEVLARFGADLDAGLALDPRALIAAHPDLAAELSAFFADDARLRRLADAGPAPPEVIGAFGPFEVLGEVARGGMGIVYRARRPPLERIVALKVILNGRFASADEVRRFRDEAEAAADLDHPAIVPIYDVGEHDGHPYFSMKLVDGGTLADDLGRFLDDPRTAARLVAEVAEAVHHAHQRGVLHRDLKPSNILLDADGRPHVVDFGLAKRLDRETEATRSGALLGSPSYMAPEQASGRRGSVTVATDVHGLGTVLYTLLAGHSPFAADSAAESIERVQSHAPAPIRTANPRVDRDLETVCLKCLEKEPSKRYASAEAVADDLRRWLSGRPILARPVGAVERGWRWCRRNPALAGLIGVVAILTVAVVVGLAVGLARIAREQESTKTALAVARDERRRVLEGQRASIHGITEPLKRLANPDFAGMPGFEAMRNEVIATAILALRNHAETSGDDGHMIDTLIHIGLLRTIAGDHPGTWDAYRQAIALAELRAARLPGIWLTWDRVGQAHSHLGMDLWQQGHQAEAAPHLETAASAFRRMVRSKDASEFHYQHAAWFLLFCPDARLRDPARAMEYAGRAAALSRGHESARPQFLYGVRPLMTLGLAHYRLGEWGQGREAVETSLRLRGVDDAYEGFVLAMCLAQQGDRATASRRYEQAERWMCVNRFGDFELHFLRDEAAALLGLPRPKHR